MSITSLFPHPPIEHHPDAALFPMMDEVALNELAADIKTSGLHEAIKVDHTARLLVDGRNRERACVIAGIEPRYERLPEKTDIFNYIVSINLRRRHLTDEQKREVVRVIAARNPNLSNRQIAKMAGVHHTTVGRLGQKSGGADAPPDLHKKTVQKKQGADGRMYSSSGQISEATRAAIVSDCLANPDEQKAIAQRHGVSPNTVAGIRNRLRQAGKLEWSDSYIQKTEPRPVAPPKPTTKELMEKRAAMGSFELTREEKGMGTVEWGRQQAEGYAPGWTNDAVHMDKVGGRIQIYTLDQIAQQRLMKRFHKILAGIEKAMQKVGQGEEYNPPIVSEGTAPSVNDLNNLSLKDRDALKVLFQRRAWLIRLVASYLDAFEQSGG